MIADVPEKDDLDDDLTFYDDLEKKTQLSDEKTKGFETGGPVVTDPEKKFYVDDSLSAKK